jgi:hypothetical protein
MIKDIRFSKFIDEVNVFSDKKLINSADLEVLIALTEEKGKQSEFLELIFFSKFVIKLYRILKKGTPGSEEYDKIKEEFSIHAEKVKEMLRLLVSLDEGSFRIFNEKYFSNTPESFGKLIDLLNDLAWVKNWHLDNKKLW